MENASPSKARTSPSLSAFTDLAAWNAFLEAETPRHASEHWLGLLSASIPETEAAMLRFTAPGDDRPLSLCLPDERFEADLEQSLESAITKRRGVLGETTDASRHVISYPIILGDDLWGAAALVLPTIGRDKLHHAMRQLQWGILVLRERILLNKTAVADARMAASHVLVELIAVALEAGSFSESCRAIATELARIHHCDRVSIGFIKRGSNRVAAISHSAHFGKDMDLVRLLGEAMDEAADQRSIVTFPSTDGDLTVNRLHGELAKAHGAGTVLTLPMHVDDAFIGAITLERSATHPFHAEEIAELDVIATALAPLFEEKRRDSRNILVKNGHWLADQMRKITGPRHGALKVSLAAALALIVVFALWKDTFRVDAEATVESISRRALVAGYDGYLMEAPARAGDVVKAGDLMATLDSRELALQRLKLQAERQGHAYEYERALGEGKRGEMRVAQNQMEQADLQIKLIDAQLQRAAIRAPFDGLVVSGDNTQSIGAAVKRGDVLYEVAPVDDYRIVLRASENDVALLQEGQAGQLLLSALPGEPQAISVTRITPVSVAAEGRNLFRVEARLEGSPEKLRPGMEGTAKVEIGSHRVIWIWTRGMRNWLSVQFWRWLG